MCSPLFKKITKILKMASAFARKQLEKYGWKEGEGLGRNKDGLNSYIKTSRHNRSTHNRDDRGNTFAGIGHESTRGGGAGFGERQNELDNVFAEIGQARKDKKRKQKEEESFSSSSDNDDVDDKKKSERRRQREEKEKKESDSDSEQEQQKKPENSAAAQKKKKQVVESSSDSSSDSDSDSDSDAGGSKDVSKMSDKDLFAVCGGVRLGRAGRHRLFDHKFVKVCGPFVCHSFCLVSGNLSRVGADQKVFGGIGCRCGYWC